MRSSAASVLAFAASAQAVYQGFNYGSTNGDGSARTASDFETYFTTAKNLVGTSGFTSARLYTMIVGLPVDFCRLLSEDGLRALGYRER
jgi:hypothetical protein